MLENFYYSVMVVDNAYSTSDYFFFFFEEWHKDVNLKSENILFHSFASPSKIGEAFIS